MQESILTSIKKLLGIAEDYKHFDADIIMHINTVLMILMQLGVGPEAGFTISDDTAVWADFLGTTYPQLEAVKTYVYLRVRLMFDPPQTSSVSQSMENLIKEFEFRLNVEVDPAKTE